MSKVFTVGLFFMICSAIDTHSKSARMSHYLPTWGASRNRMALAARQKQGSCVEQKIETSEVGSQQQKQNTCMCKVLGASRPRFIGIDSKAEANIE